MSSSSAKTFSAINPRSSPVNDTERRGTARKDSTRKILENGWFTQCICKGEYTDDYLRDACRDYGQGEVEIGRILPKLGYKSVKCWVEEDIKTGEQVIVVYSNSWHYEITLDTEQVRFTF